MTLAELVEKGADSDLLRDMIGFVCQRMMEFDVEVRIPVKPGHHSGGCRATVPVHAGPVSEAV
jgi:putative transposase